MDALIFALLGLAFGFILSRSGAGDYGFIQAMFQFRDFQLFGIFAGALAVTIPGLALIKKAGRKAPSKPFHRGNFVGGALFGIGWSITGMCPGPIFVNIGEGKVYALAALAGALAGTWLLGWAYPSLTPLLHLPPISKGGSGQG